MALLRTLSIITVMSVALAAVPAYCEDVFVEAESSIEHTFTDISEFPGIVSGDKILRLWSEAEAPDSSGFQAAFPFSVTGAQKPYHVWIGISMPPATSNFWCKIDDGEWKHVSGPNILAPYGVSNVMGWVELLALPLGPGAHKLTLRVNERRGVLERAHSLYVDAVMVTTREVRPSGLVRPADVPLLQPREIPPERVKRAGKPGPPMMMGTSVADEKANLTLKSLGFDIAQTDTDHLTVNETSPGVWDWKDGDTGLAAARKAGLMWQYFPHFHWPPEWYRKADKFVPCTGLRSRRKLACMSIWSPEILPWFDHCYSALAAHYSHGEITAIYVGIHGDFGETLFPMGWHPVEEQRFGKEGMGIADFWCGDPCALADFRQMARAKYEAIGKLNATWGTDYVSFSQIAYPPMAVDGSGDVLQSAQSRRRWLDFTDWYFDSLTKFTADVCRIARKHFPKTMLVLPVGGGEEAVVYGQDNTGIPKAVKHLGVHIRSTHAGFQSFAKSSSTMMRRISTACKFYGNPMWTEPPAYLNSEQEVSRVMESLSSGCWGFWDWAPSPVAVPDTFREYSEFFTREKPVVDVAIFFPYTDLRLRPAMGNAVRMTSMATDLRDVMDFDILDERLITDGALSRYRVLIWLEGEYAEANTITAIKRWVTRGGVLVKYGDKPAWTVEGDRSLGSILLDDANTSIVTASADGRPANWAAGKGLAIVCGDGSGSEQSRKAFYEVARDAVYNLSALHPCKRNAMELDTEWDGVYVTLLANGEAIVYNSNAEVVTKTIAETRLTLPAQSVRSILVK